MSPRVALLGHPRCLCPSAGSSSAVLGWGHHAWNGSEPGAGVKPPMDKVRVRFSGLGFSFGSPSAREWHPWLEGFVQLQ